MEKDYIGSQGPQRTVALQVVQKESIHFIIIITSFFSFFILFLQRLDPFSGMALQLRGFETVEFVGR
jgi:hypothetical protein